MSQNEADKGKNDFNRRDFIKSASSFGSLMLLMGGVPIEAKAADAAASGAKVEETKYSTEDATPVSCAVIGCGSRGREILQTLPLLPGGGKPANAPVVAICDNYKNSLNKAAKDLAPNAQAVDDYRKVLEMKEVEAVFVTTPTHLHREIVEAALQAGKHVYCEAPLAHTVEDALAIAKAAKAATKLNFQAGLQMRSDPGKEFVLKFIHTGAVGKPIMAKSQWHKRNSWRRPGTTPERDKALNWRLDSSISTGLAGEIGVHQFDVITWMFGKKPNAITGFGGILDSDYAADGRDVADTIQTIMHYPGKVNAMYDCTIANSFDSEYDVLYGTGAAILFRGELFTTPYTPPKSWLFEEANSQLFGWEIYAAKQEFYKETGITLSAGASHSVQAKGVEENPLLQSTLHYSLRSFLHNSLITGQAVTNFVNAYGADADGLSDEVASKTKDARWPAATYKDGFEATVLGIKANEAIKTGTTVQLPKSLFEI